jgi:hypothetical protein
MKEMFYEIASAITECITGCDGTGVGIEGIFKVVRYINVLENVKLFMNILALVIVAVCVVSIGMAAWNFIDKKCPNGFVSIKVESEN